MEHVKKKRIVFNSVDILDWVKELNLNRGLSDLDGQKIDVFVDLHFSKDFDLQFFEPSHIVVLSCFIQELKNKGYIPLRLTFKNESITDFLFNEVNFKAYWGVKKVHHVESPKITDLNIWRITDSEKEAYSISVHDYFKRYYFADYDLSSLKNTLNELYFNVFDHAESDGNAFSYISYNEKERKIKIAVCDFGRGIAKSLRSKYQEYDSDQMALQKSIEIGISARTQRHNRGFGLDNIVSTLAADNELKILSNRALLHIIGSKEEIRSCEIDFDFKGTLIYFDISIDSFEKEEVLNDFNFD